MGGMFSSGGGNASEGAVGQFQQQLADDQLLGFLQQMNTQQQAALAAQQKAQTDALNAAQKAQQQQQAQQGTQLAQQGIETAGQVQAVKDKPVQAAMQAAEQQLGQSQVGAPVNINAMNQGAASNLNQAAGTLPKTAYNQAGTTMPAVNPALTTAGSFGANASPLNRPANQFSMPSMSNLKFGG